MKNKFTEGPWSIDKSSYDWTIVSDNDLIVEKVGHEDMSDTEREANAQLIATSPELYKACLIVVRGYEDDGMEQMGARDEVFYKYCKEAITKATKNINNENTGN